MRLTEQPSKYDNLEKKSVMEIITDINNEDKTVAYAIEKVLPDLERLISAIERQLRAGGRMFYVGCGTGGRLSVLDVVELPNTLIAPSTSPISIALAVPMAWRLLAPAPVETASGTTPYVLHTLRHCREHGIPTGSFVNNPQSPISDYSDYPVEVITGTEYVTGSTRMKCGTAQKMICDMISTTVLIRLGRIEGNRMVNVRLINDKVVDRSVRMFMERNPSITDYDYVKEIIVKTGTVKKAEAYLKEAGKL